MLLVTENAHSTRHATLPSCPRITISPRWGAHFAIPPPRATHDLALICHPDPSYGAGAGAGAAALLIARQPPSVGAVSRASRPSRAKNAHEPRRPRLSPLHHGTRIAQRCTSPECKETPV